MEQKTKRIEAAIGAYFAACDATRERMPLKNGGFEERQIPYTLFGLAHALEMMPDKLLQCTKETRGSKSDRLIRSAVLKIAAYTAERALLGELNYQVALEILRSMDLTERAQGAATAVVLDERLSRYAE